MARKAKPAAKILIFVIIAIVMVGGYIMYGDKIVPNKKQAGSVPKGLMSGGSSSSDVIKIGVVTWGGYAGGQYYNRGFKPNSNSKFKQNYGFDVEFIVLDDFNQSREAWKADQVQLLWATIDAFPTEVAGLAEYEPIFLFQADWSRGGDAIVVRRGINSVADLRGKKIAVAEATPSHTFLLWVLDAGGLRITDIELVKAPNAIDASAMFKNQQVDAAVVWSPDDEDCVTTVKNSKVLTSTKKATHIVADGFFVKKAYLNANRDRLVKLMEGWFKGAEEINSSAQAKKKAAKILADGLKQPEDFTLKAINNVRLTTYGDNLNFFGKNSNYSGVTGEDLYNKMVKVYSALNLTGGRTPNWRVITDVSMLEAVNLQASGSQSSEMAPTFKKPTKQVREAEAFSSKPVSITFPSGSYTLDENAKYIIDETFVDIAKAFPSSSIRIEGNTDVTGNRQANVRLSKKRAKSVVAYLVSEHSFSKNRFVIKGNGPDQPVCKPANDPVCYSKNRRTDFEILE